MTTKRTETKWRKSLRKFSWTDKFKKNSYETFYDAVLTDWYFYKHKIPLDEEIELINSLFVDICPHCGSFSFIKYGKDRQGIQVYKCKRCNSKFTPLTNTIFYSHRISISEWIQFLIDIFEHHSIKTSSRDNRNSSSTGFIG